MCLNALFFEFFAAEIGFVHVFLYQGTGTVVLFSIASFYFGCIVSAVDTILQVSSSGCDKNIINFSVIYRFHQSTSFFKINSRHNSFTVVSYINKLIYKSYSHHLNATSSIVIIAKPIIAPMVARSAFPLRWDSGTTSSTTTNIIAPAAKPRA